MIGRKAHFDDRHVIVSPCESYDTELCCSIIEDMAQQLGLDEIIFPGCTVVIKPNLVMQRKPDDAATTHPEIVGAVIRAAKKRGAGRVILAESGGGLYNKSTVSSSYNLCGMTEICKREGAELNFDLSDRVISHPDAVLCRQFNIISPVIDADVLINIPKLKTHSMTGYSGAVKNLFGCVPGLMKPELHCQYPDSEQFQQMIVDINTLLKPTVVFMDAVVGMEGDGPTGGSPRHIGAIVGALNPFVADIAGCSLIGVKPENIHMLALGMKQGLCPKSLDETELTGDPLSMTVSDYVQPKTKRTDFLDHVPAVFRPFVALGEKIAAPRPVINKKKCVGCGKCAESCPQHTIVINNRKAKIDRCKCIKCYCCHEMCPKQAINIKRQILFRL